MSYHASADRGTLFESGDELIDRIRSAIVARRPVLVTGPRGSGKTHCVREAIKLSIEAKEIGGSRFLQGNREIPREYLSEDMLVVSEDEHGRPTLSLRDALVIRHPSVEGNELKERRKDTSNLVWPAVAAEHASRWEKTDWTALFLDEINRFGDGFLDSLLSLTEERTIVRSGDELRVPLTVVATANPPGYDVTAKKLSPPLQSRMARSYRVAQPSLEALSIGILPGLLARHCSEMPDAERPQPGPDTLQVCAGIGLCLWGMPSLERKGCGFLTSSTIALLEQAAKTNSVLSAAMIELGELVAFGPDARSIGDWLGAAAGAARSLKATTISDVHLVDTVLEALGHKLRETFNEGVEPGKAVRLAELVVLVTRTVLGSPSLRRLFVAPYPQAVRHLLGLGEHAKLSNDVSYIVAKRLAGLPGLVEALAVAENDVNAIVLGVPALRALQQIHRDFVRRAANASDADVSLAMMQHAQVVEQRLQDASRATLKPSQLCAHLRESETLPPHVVQRLEQTLPPANIAVPDALAAVDLIEQALLAAAGPAPAASALVGFSPALADTLARARLWRSAALPWTAHAQKLGLTNVALTNAIGNVLQRELSFSARQRLSSAMT